MNFHSGAPATASSPQPSPPEEEREKISASWAYECVLVRRNTFLFPLPLSAVLSAIRPAWHLFRWRILLPPALPTTQSMAPIPGRSPALCPTGSTPLWRRFDEVDFHHGGNSGRALWSNECHAQSAVA